VIIVEGPDGGGKTTLARNLSETLDIDILPKAVGADTQARVDLREWTDQHVAWDWHIYDRHNLISDPIYSIILDRSKPDIYDPEWLMSAMMKFYEARPIIIYCIPPLPVVTKNCIEGADDNSAVIPHLPMIHQAYIARASIDEAFGVGTFYDYTQDDNNWVIDYVRAMMSPRNRGSAHG